MTEFNKLGSAAARNTGLLLVLAACPAMGASADLCSALTLGVCVLVLSLVTALVLSLLKKQLEGKAVIAAAVIIAAGFASFMVMLLRAFFPAVYPTVWTYLAVCCVNFMLISQSEQGLSKALRASLIFFAAIVITAFLRELFGAASVAGMAVPFLADYKVGILTQAPGGFIVYALVMAALSGIGAKKEKGE